LKLLKGTTFGFGGSPCRERVDGRVVTVAVIVFADMPGLFVLPARFDVGGVCGGRIGLMWLLARPFSHLRLPRLLTRHRLFGAVTWWMLGMPLGICTSCRG
jgi:hypothetical protein